MKDLLRLTSTLIILLLSLASAPAQQPDTLRHSILAPPTGLQSEAQLGYSVAVEGGYTVVGAPYDDLGGADTYDPLGGQDTGVVKVFDSATGVLVYVLLNPNPAGRVNFGRSVAISGTRVVVGAYKDNIGGEGAGSAYVYDLSSGTPTVPVATLNNPSPAVDDLFGTSVAISGTRVVVGAVGDDTGASNAGSAYVYDLSNGTPTVPVVTLNNPSPALNDYFGNSVAISGTRVVVGAYQDGATDDGSAYVYDLASGMPTVPVATLNNPSPAGYDYFGFSVAISGTRVVVSAAFYDGGLPDIGRAYVYDLLSGMPSIPVVTLDKPGASGWDLFGWSVAIFGTRVVVGIPGNGNGPMEIGAAYVYDVAGEEPTVPVVMLNNPGPAADGNFGNAVAISGTRLVVGAYQDDTGATNAGSAYVYDLGSGSPTVPTATLNNPGPAGGEKMGYSVAISGTRMVTGAPFGDTGATDAGTAYVYDLASGEPTVPVATLNNPTPAEGDAFGISTAISGTLVVVGASNDDTGAPNAGSAYVYDLSSATPTVPVFTLNNPDPTNDDIFGTSAAISGTRVVVGASNAYTAGGGSGSAYVYDLASGTPTIPVATLNPPGPPNGEGFGISVAISGTRVVVGADREADTMGVGAAGSAYVYDLSSGTPVVPTVVLDNPIPEDSERFGFSVAISGTRVLVGAINDSTGGPYAGSAYVYDLANGTPTVPVATLNNPGVGYSESFGWSVAISGTHAVIGIRFDYTSGISAGRAYVYDLASATPTVPVATLTNPSPEFDDRFGYSVAIDGTTVAIGTPGDDTTMTDKGSAYIFAPANPDYDADGLLDIWEHARFGSITAHTASDDADGDGRTELLEQAFDSDPLFSDPLAAPRPVDEGGFLTLTLSKRAGVAYTVETAGSPDAAAFSMGTTTIITNNASMLKVRDNFTPATAAQRFMRLKVTAAP